MVACLIIPFHRPPLLLTLKGASGIGRFCRKCSVWNTAEASAKGEEQFRNSIEVAVKQTLNGGLGNGTKNQQLAKRVGVALQDTAEDEVRRFVSSSPGGQVRKIGESITDAIETIASVMMVNHFLQLQMITP